MLMDDQNNQQINKLYDGINEQEPYQRTRSL